MITATDLGYADADTQAVGQALNRLDWLYGRKRLPATGQAAQAELLEWSTSMGEWRESDATDWPEPPYSAMTDRDFREHVTGRQWRPRKPTGKRLAQAKASFKRHQQETVTRIAYEAHDKLKRGWGAVFWTLTFSRLDLDPAKELSKFIRRYKQAIKHHLRQRGRCAEGMKSTDLLTYCAVLERGGQRGRLHWHVITFSPTVPFASDPNGMGPGTRREIDGLKTLWTCYGEGRGHCSPKAVLIGSPCEYFADWNWPMENRAGVNYPAKASPPIAIAHYMGAYLGKHHYGKRPHSHCRAQRTSQGFGKGPIRTMAQQLPWVDDLSAFRLAAKTSEAHCLGRRVPASMLCHEVARLHTEGMDKPDKVRAMLDRPDTPTHMLDRITAGAMADNAAMRLNAQAEAMKEEIVKAATIATQKHYCPGGVVGGQKRPRFRS